MHRSYVLLPIAIVYIRQGWRYGERNRMQQRNHDYNVCGTIVVIVTVVVIVAVATSGSRSCCIRRSNDSSSSYRFSSSSTSSSRCSYAQKLRKI